MHVWDIGKHEQSRVTKHPGEQLFRFVSKIYLECRLHPKQCRIFVERFVLLLTKHKEFRICPSEAYEAESYSSM